MTCALETTFERYAIIIFIKNKKKKKKKTSLKYLKSNIASM